MLVPLLTPINHCKLLSLHYFFGRFLPQTLLLLWKLASDWKFDLNLGELFEGVMGSFEAWFGVMGARWGLERGLTGRLFGVYGFEVLVEDLRGRVEGQPI